MESLNKPENKISNIVMKKIPSSKTAEGVALHRLRESVGQKVNEYVMIHMLSISSTRTYWSSFAIILIKQELRLSDTIVSFPVRLIP